MTDDERTAAELRGLLGITRGLGLDEATVRKKYEIVGEKPRRLALECIVFDDLNYDSKQRLSI
ncbi:UNVERIFIED_ORG: hypothetical protein M2438_001210 [Methylobacterium sp. SuP10 SLI 274]|uniref:hypothetical protein n=1 Tax=Methylorubrum extorquens TaxID=408 RepID=UPI0020A14F58|nr:hypothetical protein [Methylorubrum extorquens]MDF9862421.1 hypothetical protein [Methylorubrum pseudosasae]MDH6636035.1 hypothetical protein [Methylobacterium sp. SuP10 SLI 274]MDH6665209.1 hypothetical protein [Methylorubrum zatmanii]MCP1557136.1 hypothetical protein [Methylorubrum extorquens]MDF9790714.1 hypothetical protein [Methylorubrum extorquens]